MPVLSLTWEAHSRPSQTFEMGLVAKIITGFMPLTIFAKGFILDIWLGSEYVSDINISNNCSAYFCNKVKRKTFPAAIGNLQPMLVWSFWRQKNCLMEPNHIPSLNGDLSNQRNFWRKLKVDKIMLIWPKPYVS